MRRGLHALSGPALVLGLVHPGVINTRESLDLVKARVAAGAQPWKAAYEKLKNDPLAALSREPRPRAVVECGPYSKPNYGCSDERDDAAAAYAHALLWSIEGNKAHAEKAIELMNAWARTLREHTNHNAPLQSGWAASNWTKAAEIIRHSDAGWAAADVARFQEMLLKVYLPMVRSGAEGGVSGNWQLTMIDAQIGIGVFADDQAIFDDAVAKWRWRVPSYIYMTSDGPTPQPPPGGSVSLTKYWQEPGRFVDGLGQETCRDLGHLSYGFASMLYAAETARIQGVDLYGEQSQRLRAGLEYNARLQAGWPGDGVCGGKVTRNMTETLELGYNHYAHRLGLPMPFTQARLEGVRPTGQNHHIVWETLTHFGSPAAASQGASHD
jgi:hypothetical protein